MRLARPFAIDVAVVNYLDCSMDCCEPTTTKRPDRPHTFLHHAQSSCVTCHRAIEGRVVERDGKILTLVFCPDCGQTIHDTHSSAAAYMDEFVAKAVAAPGSTAPVVFKTTTSVCPTCLALTAANVVIENNRVYFEKNCATCGPSKALVSEDAAYYVRAYTYARSGTEPLDFGNKVEHGCPTDCGTCNDHEQHTCLPIVEVTDHCNLECPICIVNNQYSNHMSVAAFSRIVDRLIKAEGECESLALSGGEPTSHPDILGLIDAANRPEIGRIMVITNGLRLGRDRELAAGLKARGAYIGLQLDGFDAATHTIVRGRDLTKEKTAALAMCKEFNLPTQIIFVAAKGVNDHQIGQVVDLMMKEDFIISVNFQPVAHTGLGGGVFAHDPLDRLTIPGIIHAIEAQTAGRMRASDFNPLPCSHPQCVSLAYVLRMPDGTYLPFARFVDYGKHDDRLKDLLKSSATLPASREVHNALLEVVHDVYANDDTVERADEVLTSLRGTMKAMFPDRKLTHREQIRIGEGFAKAIFMHAYMDRHDFDLERLRKCCHHYPQQDGRIMPACGFNMFHRGAAKGTNTPTASWAKPVISSGADGKIRLPVV
jgi:7,8-dihydro-6-hydroxymethylpterin dimethyltransferase